MVMVRAVVKWHRLLPRPLLNPLLNPLLHPLLRPLLHNFAMTMADAIKYMTRQGVLHRWMVEGACPSRTPLADGVADLLVFQVATCASQSSGYFHKQVTMGRA